MSIESNNEKTDFLGLNAVLESLIDFVRPETFLGQDDIESFRQIRSKSKNPVDVQSIRSSSAIYRFLAKNQKLKPNKNLTKKTASREDLLKKLHEKMPHRQKNLESDGKRKRTKEKSTERPKKIRMAPKENFVSVAKTNGQVQVEKEAAAKLTFGRFDFNTNETISEKSKAKNSKKGQSKEKKLKKTLKKLEVEEENLKVLRDEDPERGEKVLSSKRWKTAFLKAKGEKVKDNALLLRKTIKREEKRRQKSSNKWKKNKKETEKRVKQRQEKRQENIQKRKDEKKAKIKKKLIKKGRLIS